MDEVVRPQGTGSCELLQARLGGIVTQQGCHPILGKQACDGPDFPTGAGQRAERCSADGGPEDLGRSLLRHRNLRSGAVRIQVDPQRPCADFERSDLAISPEFHRYPDDPAAGGHHDQVAGRLENPAIVFQEQVAVLDAEQVGDAVGIDEQDGEAVIRRVGHRIVPGPFGEGRVADRQEADRVTGPRTWRAETGKHRARWSIADAISLRPRRLGGDEDLKRYAGQVFGGQDDDMPHSLKVGLEGP